jgi:hypothetical protein
VDGSDDIDPWGQPRPALPRRGCGKASYASESAARRSMRTMQKWGRGRSYAGRLHPYLCRECRAWHVGHTSYEG